MGATDELGDGLIEVVREGCAIPIFGDCIGETALVGDADLGRVCLGGFTGSSYTVVAKLTRPNPTHEI